MREADAVAGLWSLAGGDAAALDQLALTGAEPALPSSFRLDTVAQAAIAASGLAAAELRHAAGLPRQRVTVAMREAAIEFQSERHLRVDGAAPPPGDPLMGLYRTRDGFVRIHTNFAHHRARVLALLGCEPTRESVASALAQRDAVAFETDAHAAGAVVTALRDAETWAAHPQAQAIAALPVLSIERIGDAPPRPLPARARPLGGITVIDLTRIIAGPVAAGPSRPMAPMCG
jgi:crotonobetainyl-CoA:carnitine CoA-transferase CaiB-like acyl-CoA transferase